jgi:hypothetical protein
MANSVHFGTTAGSLTDLSGSSYGVTVETTEVSGMPDVQASVSGLPGSNGALVYGRGFGPRTIDATLRVVGNDAANLQGKIDNILYLIDPRRGVGWWKFDHQADRIWNGAVVRGFGSVVRGNRMARLPLQIQLASALAYGVDETTQTVTVSGSPQAFSVPGSGVLGGTASAEPVWLVKNTSGSTSGVLTLANSSTAETVSTSVGIANGHWLRFDRARQIIERSTDSGVSWTSFMSSRGAQRNIPTLAAKQGNSCALTGLTGGEIVITYRTRFI